MSTVSASSVPSARPPVRAARAWAAQSATTPLAPFSIDRREPFPDEVVIDILYCGVCHSDLHQVRNEWNGSMYPSCRARDRRPSGASARRSRSSRGRPRRRRVHGRFVPRCAPCSAGLEQYCENVGTLTYNGPDRHSAAPTYGGYSESIVVTESFALSVPEDSISPRAAPLLCAGITTYSPLRHWKVGPRKKVGIVGLGGLGHMGVKFARAFGAHVVLFTTSASKVRGRPAAWRARSRGIEGCRRHEEARVVSFDFILDAVSADHDINAYLRLLKLDGTLTLVGAPERPLPVTAFSLLMARRSFAGSGIGGIKETQEMLDFCAEHAIVSDIELIRIEQINDAYERMLRSDVRYRFVIDMASLKG